MPEINSVRSSVDTSAHLDQAHASEHAAAQDVQAAGSHMKAAAEESADALGHRASIAGSRARQVGGAVTGTIAGAGNAAGARLRQGTNLAANGLSQAGGALNDYVARPVVNAGTGVVSGTFGAVRSGYQQVATNLRGPVTPRLSTTGSTPLATIDNARGVTFLGRHTGGLNKLLMFGSAAILGASLFVPAIGAGVLALSVWQIAQIGLGLTALDFIASRFTRPSVAGYETKSSQDTAQRLVDLHDATENSLRDEAKTLAFRKNRAQLDGDEAAHNDAAAGRKQVESDATDAYKVSRTALTNEFENYSEGLLSEARSGIRAQATVVSSASAEVTDKDSSAAGRTDAASTSQG